MSGHPRDPGDARDVLQRLKEMSEEQRGSAAGAPPRAHFCVSQFPGPWLPPGQQGASVGPAHTPPQPDGQNKFFWKTYSGIL